MYLSLRAGFTAAWGVQCISFCMKAGFAAASFSIILLAGCYSNNTDALREHTADATAAAKRDAGAIAAGVIEGLARKGPIDINRASFKDLQKLPGITPDAAGAIISERPYEDTLQLVRKHILSRPQYNRIRAQIMVK
jgi:DNA uptake protein ComE-like DNA-binding protein